MSDTSGQSAFPRTVSLPGGAQIQLRMMDASDRDPILAFARRLPPEDLLFLRVDLTEDAVVDVWVAQAAAGRSTTLVAYDSDGLVGYAAIHREPTSWTRHLGEIRVNVDPRYRSHGLGRVLINAVFDLAGTLGLQKVTARMTSDQLGAQAAFRRLGFVPEAHLADFVMDRNGTTRDMVIMSFDVTGHTDQAEGTVRVG